ncbi:MAG: hypothetical protein QOD84_2866 [Acidobacteriaceae bacterium]|jgi:hypothetical protein
MKGFFDLAGLPIPDGSSSAQYELSVEGLDPYWSRGVGAYGGQQVHASGSATEIIISASIGSDVQQDIVMGGTPSAKRDNPQPAYPRRVPDFVSPHQYIARALLLIMTTMRFFFPGTALSLQGPALPEAPRLPSTDPG